LDYNPNRVQIEARRHDISNDRWSAHDPCVFNNLTRNYKLQKKVLEKIIGNKQTTIGFDELRKEINLRFERLTMQSEPSNKISANEEQALTTSHSKVECRNCGVPTWSQFCSFQHKKKQGKIQIDKNSQPSYCAYSRKTGHIKAIWLILNRRKESNGNGNNKVSTGVAGTTADVMFNLMSDNLDFSENIWIGDSGASCHYCNNDEGLFDVIDFLRESQ
jgi:hypothetical protein